MTLMIDHLCRSKRQREKEKQIHRLRSNHVKGWLRESHLTTQKHTVLHVHVQQGELK